jgi:hypothetical protein
MKWGLIIRLIGMRQMMTDKFNFWDRTFMAERSKMIAYFQFDNSGRIEVNMIPSQKRTAFFMDTGIVGESALAQHTKFDFAHMENHFQREFFASPAECNSVHVLQGYILTFQTPHNGMRGEKTVGSFQARESFFLAKRSQNTIA